jgi:cell division septation protein DedD
LEGLSLKPGQEKMNLKSVVMASGLVLTFAAGAWLSTIMLASPQRSNREAAVDQAQGQPTAASVRPPRTLPELPASDSILPPLPPLPEAPAAVPPLPPPVVQAPPVETPAIAAQEQPPSPPVEQTVQPPETAPPDPPPPVPEPTPPAPPPVPVAVEALPAIPEAPPAMAEAPAPEPQVTSMTEVAPPPTEAVPLVPAAESEPEIDPGIAALSALVARSPSAPAPNASPAPPLPVQQPSPPAPSSAAAPSVPGPYFTIQVGSFQDPANAASLARSLGTKGWEAFVVDWTNGGGQVWKVVRVGRYPTEAQAAEASTELMSAANLRGNVIKVR